MTRADITHVIVKGERFVGVAGMERTVLGTVSRGMTRSMATTSVISRETRTAYKTGKGHLVTVVWKTGTANAAQLTACLRIAMSMDITSKKKPAKACLISFFFMLERLSIAFTANSKREFVLRDQVPPLLVVNCSIQLHENRSIHANFTHENSLSCFYLLVSHFENFLTWISRLPCDVNAMLYLSIINIIIF